jgi:hypothetical protein
MLLLDKDIRQLPDIMCFMMHMLGLWVLDKNGFGAEKVLKLRFVLWFGFQNSIHPFLSCTSTTSPMKEA